MMFLPPVYWLFGALFAETVSRIVQGVLSTYFVRARLPQANPWVVIGDMVKYGAIAVGAGLLGMGALHFVGAFDTSNTVTGAIWGGFWRAVLVAVVVSVGYFALIATIDRRNFQTALGMLGSRIPYFRRFASEETASGDGEDFTDNG